MLTFDGKGRDQDRKICPFLGIPCQEVCPAWLQEVDDCVFHVCLTEVKATFFEAAKSLDKKLTAPPGSGAVALKNIHDNMTGDNAQDSRLVQGYLNGFLTAGMLDKISHMTLDDWIDAFAGVEQGILFRLGEIFNQSDEESEHTDVATLADFDLGPDNER